MYFSYFRPSDVEQLLIQILIILLSLLLLSHELISDKRLIPLRSLVPIGV